MYKYYFILSKLLKFNYKSLKSIVNLSIITSTFICVILIPISLSVINGFEENIISKIISFDGYARVYLDEINSQEYKDIENIPSIIKFHEDNALIKTNKGSEAVTIIAYIDSKHLYNSGEFLLYDTIDVNRTDNEGIFIGQSLHERLFPIYSDNIEKKVILVNSDNTIQHTKILGVFQTYVPLYDEHFVLSTIKGYSATGFIVNQNTYDFLSSNIKSLFYTYDERYYEFLKWLSSYDLPIFILLFSIVFIAIANNIFCFNIDLINRKNDSYIFNLLGLSSKEIHLIYSCKYFILNILGITFGSIVSAVLIYIQLNYNLIKVPNEIYFSSIIPLSVKVEYFIYIPLVFILQSFYLFIRKRRYFNAL